MGTSGAYGGSDGAWSDFRDDLDDWLESVPGAAAGDDPPPAPHTGDPDAAPPDPPTVALLRPAARALGWGRGGAGGPTGGGAGIQGGPTGGGAGAGGGARSRARAARVGGRLAAGIGGLYTGSAADLAELGLNLAELRSLDPYEQAHRLIEAAVEGSPQSLDDDELRFAASSTAVWALDRQAHDIPPEVEDVIRRFVVDYVYRIVLTEAGATLRDGTGDGRRAVVAEDRLRATISALARGATITVPGRTTADLTRVVEDVLASTLAIEGLAR